MNAERLLQLYDRVSEAPDAIPRLRRFILDLAVRGKLVEQDSTDEPAAELLRKIEDEKVRLVKAGEIRKPKDLPPVTEPPYSLPKRWIWARMRQVTSDRGQKIPTDRFTYLDVTSIDKETGVISDPKILESSEAPSRARKITRKGDVIYSCVRPYLLNVALITDDFDPEPIASTAFAVLNGHGLLASRYIWIVLRSPFMVTCVEENQRGQAYPAINDADFSLLPFPLPPLGEQHRIAAKVDELMALCDTLEAEREKREATRDRLTTASLSRLTAPDVDEKQFKAHADFAIKVLPELTTRPDQIKVLRQTILDLAVRGKLVEQDPNDELAAELLQKIKIEKARLVQAGRFKTLEAEFSRKPDDFPFSLPKVWTWTCLDDLAAVARGGSPRPIKSYLTTEQNGIPWIKIGDSVRGSIYIDSTKEKIRPEGLSKSRLVVPGDLLLSNSMSFGYPYITNVEGCIHDGWLVIRTPETLINKLFLHAVFCSSHAKESFLRAASGAVVQNLNADKARSLSIPLPPLAEQHRIVAKVDELMAQCDQLELALHSGRGTRRHLLEALLVGALEPLAMEAA